MYCHHPPIPGSPVVQPVEAVLRLASARDPDHEVGGLGEPQQPEQPPAGGHGEAGQWSAGCWHAGPGGEGDHCNHWPLLLDTALMMNVCFRVCPPPGAWPGEAATEWLMVAAALGATFLK